MAGSYSGRAGGVILIAAAGGAFLFRHELKTLYSLKKVDDNVLYTMKYDGDYGFDEFWKQVPAVTGSWWSL